MKTIKVFLDTSTVNRLLDIDRPKENDPNDGEDRLYLSRVVADYAEQGIVQLFVNPTVELEIENTRDPERRKQLMEQFKQYHFTSYNVTIFPFTFPATFLKEEEGRAMDDVFACLPSEYGKDRKVFADAMCNSEIEILLTTDRSHLANDRFRNLLRDKGLDKEIAVFTPKGLLEHLDHLGCIGGTA